MLTRVMLRQTDFPLTWRATASQAADCWMSVTELGKMTERHHAKAAGLEVQRSADPFRAGSVPPRWPRWPWVSLARHNPVDPRTWGYELSQFKRVFRAGRTFADVPFVQFVA